MNFLSKIDRSLYNGFKLHGGENSVSLHLGDDIIEVSLEDGRYYGHVTKNYDYEQPLQTIDCMEEDTIIEWVKGMIEFVVQLSQYVECSYCGAYVQEKQDGTLAYHDFPKPTRQICPGVGFSKAIPNVN